MVSTATCRELRHLLASPTLPRILRILDAIPSPRMRSSTLSRLLSIDSNSLSKSGGGTFLADRSSPPPLEQLISSLTGDGTEDDRGREWDEDGWWLGKDGGGVDRVWIGEEERRLMRVWAGVVCRAIDGGGGEGWGEGGLGWEI